jgi:LysM repeat protein
VLVLSAVVVPHVVAGPITAEATASCSQKYVVQWGDSWSLVASRAKTSLSQLLAANNVDASAPLFAGVTICLPDGATMPTTTTTAPAPSDPSAPTTVPAPTTTVPPVIPIQAFPVQGNCWYTDTWQAPRGGGRRHEGVDIIARAGLYVYAVVDGTLTRQAVDRPGSLSGNAWWLTAPNRDYFFYAHLSAFAPGLSVGSKVKAGQVIGWIGSTGNSSTPHLHFEVHPNGGRAVNPTPTVRAVDACRVTKPLPQPGGAPPPTMPPPTTTTTTPAPTTTKPAPTTTKPAPTTTKPAPTTVPAPTTTKPAAPTTVAPPPPPSTQPLTACAQAYSVQRGDGWLRIASSNKLSLASLLAANGFNSSSAPLFAGSTICLRRTPAPTLPPTTLPPTTLPPTTLPPTTLPATTTAPPATLPPTTVAPPSANASRWQFIAPQTAFDSLWANQPLAAGTRHTVRVDRARGVASTTTGVVVRLTATSVGAGGYLVSFPCDAPTPAVSQLSFGPGETAVGTSMVEVVGGSVCVVVSAAAHVKVEILATAGQSGVGVQPVAARRVLDTRTAARLEPGVRVPITPAALGVVPGTQALTASISIVDPAGAGTLSLGFCNAGPWTTPITADPLSSFSMTMRVNASGWCISSSVATHVIVDVNAVWAGSSGPRAVDPSRLFDSRSTPARIASRQVSVQVAGRHGVPATATAAVLSITTVTGSTASSVFVVPCGQRPSAGTVTAQRPGEVLTGAAVVGLGNGAVCLSATNPADVIVDVVGFV